MREVLDLIKEKQQEAKKIILKKILLSGACYGIDIQNS